MPDREDRFRALVESSPAGIYVTDADGNCTYVNRRWCEMAGMEPGEALGRGWVRAMHPDDREMIAQRWYAAAQARGCWELEYRMQTPQGRSTWVSGRATAIHDERGQVLGYLGMNVDISERKEAERRLRESEQRYAQLLAAITAYRYSVTLEGGVPVSTEHGPGCLATTGYTPQEFAADPWLWFNMVHPDDRAQVQQHAARVLCEPAVPPLEHRIVHKDGSVRWVRDTIVRHVDEAGTLVRYDGLIEDITERKMIERRLHHVLESAPDAMVVTDQRGCVVLANAQTEKMFGYSREELFGQTIEILVPERYRELHRSQRVEYMAAPRTRMMGERSQLSARRKDGSEFPAEIGLSPIETEEGVLIAAAVRDVTERIRVERELELNLKIQSALTSLLQMSLAAAPLEQHLERTLDLLFSIPWIGLEARGAVFLADEGSQALTLKVHRGLSQPLLAACRSVPFGRCLCGRAAVSRQLVYVGCLDQRHETRCPDIAPHGHYCIPILWEQRLLGVMTLFVKEHHQRKADEERFLAAVADVLAGIIRRTQAEESLRQSEERFDLAVRGTEAGIWDWNLLSNEVYFSPMWKSMLGYAEHEIAGDYAEWETRLHPDDRQRALATLRDYLEGKTPEYELEHRLRHKDGSYRWILARGTAVRDPSGKPCRMAGSHLDITERKLSEQKLREQEVQLVAAQRIQERILPRTAPTAPGFEIAGALVPAEFAAGDFFDYLRMPDGALGIVVGDVAGHGFSSALLMASVVAHLRSFVEDHTDVEEVLGHTNSVLGREVEEGRFVTLFFGHIEPSSRRLRFVSAGHPSGYLLGRSGEVKAVMESSTLPLGVLPDTLFPVSQPIALEPYDLVVLATDGLLEARSPAGELFGAARMLEVVRECAARSAGEIVRSLQQAACSFAGRPEPLDDVTAVVIRVE